MKQSHANLNMCEKKTLMEAKIIIKLNDTERENEGTTHLFQQRKRKNNT